MSEENIFVPFNKIKWMRTCLEYNCQKLNRVIHSDSLMPMEFASDIVNARDMMINMETVLSKIMSSQEKEVVDDA